VPGTLLFRYWREARALWDQLAGVPGIRAAALMPDHIHVLLPESSVSALKAALRAYALWRNHDRGERGPVWEHGSLGRRPLSDQHGETTVRYIHLNPCRAQLAADPLAWAFSTHRDACGLAVPPIVGRVHDPDAFQADLASDRFVVSNDPRLPAPQLSGRTRGIASIQDVFAAVSALTRTPAAQLKERGAARSLLLRAARTYADASPPQIAAAAGVSLPTVFRAKPKKDARRDPAVQLVGSVLHDGRFALLTDRQVWRGPARGWARYRDRR
jgi:REP element-mobilizing transposase RayT